MTKVTALAISVLIVSQGHAQRLGSMPEKHTQILRSHCYGCHDADTSEGGVDLQNLSLKIDNLQTAETWRKVLNVLNSGEMPPDDSEPLSAKEKTEFLADLSRELVVARNALADTGGIITMRRLNRREYKNTIESLLGVTVDVSELPDETNAGGFDTNGASLYFSGDQFEQYLKIARRALDQALSPAKPTRIERVEAEDSVLAFIFKDYHKRDESGRLNEDSLSHLSYKELSESGPTGYRWFNHQAWLNNPLSKTGSPLYNLFFDFALPEISLPDDGVGQRFVIRVRVGMLSDDVPDHRRYLEFGSAPKGVQRGELSFAGYKKVSATIDAPEMIEFVYEPVTRDELKIRVRERHINSLNAAKKFFRDAVDETDQGPPPALWVDWVEWEGPISSQPSSEHENRIFIPRKDGEPIERYHRRVLEEFATRAFRTKRPTERFIDRLMSMYRGEIEGGVHRRDALKEQLAVVLASPGFLYLNEPKVNGRDELSDQELAVRLSYFQILTGSRCAESHCPGILAQFTIARRRWNAPAGIGVENRGDAQGKYGRSDCCQATSIDPLDRNRSLHARDWT